MNILPIYSLPPRSPLNPHINRAQTPGFGITADDIQKLIPAPKKDEVKSVWELIPVPSPQNSSFPLLEILNQRFEFQIMLLKFNQNTGVDADSGDDYERYLEYPNTKLMRQANMIVDRSDSNDEKMYKIEQWVVENIEYVHDINNYGMSEYWAIPSITMLKGKGDCEDGAFLLHSLALHAKVPMARLRTYGGVVELEEGISLLGGHAWTSYKRESDDEWIEVDWCYYPTDKLIAERTAMRYDTKYVDDFFYVDAFKTVDTALLNRIRRPVSALFIDIYS